MRLRERVGVLCGGVAGDEQSGQGKRQGAACWVHQKARAAQRHPGAANLRMQTVPAVATVGLKLRADRSDSRAPARSGGMVAFWLRPLAR